MSDTFYIARTLKLAARGRGTASPNPMVGALLVKRGRIIAEGYHKKAGTPHAEAIAIDKAGRNAKGATLFISLEPCSHRDKRTPPCTGKIISAGVRKVVVAMEDPNPRVSGRGLAELEKAGIEVVSGILEEKARRLNEHYIKHITTGLPFVILKIAMTLDGKIATPEGESKWITGEKARSAVQRLRAGVDAVMSAIGTVKADNPRLTCRIRPDRQPVRVIVDPFLHVGPDAAVLSTPPGTILVTRKPFGDASSVQAEKRTLLDTKNIKVIEYEGERLDLKWLMKKLGDIGIISVLVEAGSSFNSSCLENGIVDKVMFFIAPKIIGGKESFPAVGGTSYRKLADAYRISDMHAKKIGEDILIEGYIRG
jgi:diaminohydroxyphosphoribosylaminopyrimidine deaminase/5-amino-6-(5-phosphoribosylamino)uracil reductase